MIPHPGIDAVAWSYLLDRIHHAPTLLDLARLERSITLVHGETGPGLDVIRRAIAERRAELTQPKEEAPHGTA